MRHQQMLGATVQNLVARNLCTPAVKYARIQWNLRHCAKSRKVLGLSPDRVIEIFHRHYQTALWLWGRLSL